MSLYQKYRPNSFGEMIGNEDLITNLQGLIARKDPPHAFLFYGPAGCGKTTLGRIVAKELGCHEQDFVEIDTADFRGIETARNLRHNAYYKGLMGERRGWLIDECHKLTNDAQNALLKGLEDPPDHCYYVLATTDPEKLIETVRSRCSIHSVKPLTVFDMVRLMSKICVQEGVPLSKKILSAVAKRASVSFDPDADLEEETTCYPRFALQILEKVIVANPTDQVRIIREADDISKNTGSLVISMLRKQDWKVVAGILSVISEDDIEPVRRGVLNYCRRVLLNGENDLAGEIMHKFSEPFFNSGLAGLTLACYMVHKGR